MKTEYAKSSTKPKLEKPKKIIPFFTVMRVPGGWAYAELSTDEDGNVLSMEMSNPDTKAIIIERFKINVGKYWAKIDEQTI